MMKKRILFRVAALALCAVLALGACGTLEDFDFWGLLEEDPMPHVRERRTIPFSEMVYARPDAEHIKAEVQKQIGNISAAQSYDDVTRAMEASAPILNNFVTMYKLAELNRYRFATDAGSEEEYRWMSETMVEINTLGTELNRAIMNSSFAEQYRLDVGDYYYQSMEKDLLLESPKAEEYKKQRKQLAADYNNLLTSATVEWEGEQLTYEEMMSRPDTDVFAYFYELAPQYAEIYAQLIELDKLTAEVLGFDDPAEMYYLSYGRDYTPADTLALCNNIRRIFCPLLPDTIGLGIVTQGIGLDEAFAKMPGALGKIDAGLAEAFEQMVGYGLYDCEAREGKHPGIGFCTDIVDYDAPFIYQYWDESDFTSASTLIHEFGHYYDTWLRYDDSRVFNLDLMEVFSQGMEFLMQPHFGDFLSAADAENARVGSIVDILISGILYQSVLEEFQIRAYALDSVDAVSLGRLYSEVLDDYYLGSQTDEHGAANDWVQITHLFDTPYYTISYVTSALGALQIWAQSRTDYEGAAEKYMNLLYADHNHSFTQIMENAGLNSIHEPSTMRDIAGEMAALFGGDTADWFEEAA